MCKYIRHIKKLGIGLEFTNLSLIFDLLLILNLKLFIVMKARNLEVLRSNYVDADGFLKYEYTEKMSKSKVQRVKIIDSKSWKSNTKRKKAWMR
jgi:hypothetical protein